MTHLSVIQLELTSSWQSGSPITLASSKFIMTEKLMRLIVFAVFGLCSRLDLRKFSCFISEVYRNEKWLQWWKSLGHDLHCIYFLVMWNRIFSNFFDQIDPTFKVWSWLYRVDLGLCIAKSWAFFIIARTPLIWLKTLSLYVKVPMGLFTEIYDFYEFYWSPIASMIVDLAKTKLTYIEESFFYVIINSFDV